MTIDKKLENLNRETSEDIALQALLFISEDTKRLSHFLKITGFSQKSIKENIMIPDFLIGVLDYLLSEDSLLLTFCSNKDIDPAIVEPAKIYLEAHTI